MHSSSFVFIRFNTQTECHNWKKMAKSTDQVTILEHKDLRLRDISLVSYDTDTWYRSSNSVMVTINLNMTCLFYIFFFITLLKQFMCKEQTITRRRHTLFMYIGKLVFCGFISIVYFVVAFAMFVFLFCSVLSELFESLIKPCSTRIKKLLFPLLVQFDASTDLQIN